MAGRAPSRYKATQYNAGGTYTTTTTGDGSVGWGHYNQIAARLVVGDVTGGADTFDVKIQFRTVGSTWVDLITFTQATGATSETKIVVRDATNWWTDEIRVVYTVGAGATATGVDLIVTGAVA